MKYQACCNKICATCQYVCYIDRKLAGDVLTSTYEKHNSADIYALNLKKVIIK